MISRENIEFITKSGFEVVGLVPETNKEVWECVTRWEGTQLERPRYIVERASGAKVYMRTWRAPIFGRKAMRVASVLDPVRATYERIERDGLIRAVEKTTNPARLRELRDDLGALAVAAPGRRGFTVDMDQAEEDRRGDGKFLMFSTDDALDAEQMFRIYFQRDEIEKAFRTIKGELSLGPIRYQRRDRIDAYTTVVYLAYLLWSHVQERLREKYPSMSVSKAIKLVEDVHTIRFGAGKQNLEWTTRRSTEQERLLKLVGAHRLLCSG